MLGQQPCAVYRFLRTAHAELDGRTALDAMKAGEEKAVLNARNQASGAGLPDMAKPVLPDPSFATRPLVVATIKVGATWRRMYETRFPNPLGYGPVLNRFSNPTGRAFGAVYLASTAKVAFVETTLRDRADGRDGEHVVALGEIERRSLGSIVSIEPLVWVSCSGVICHVAS
jgi:hypothetical protein